MQKNLVIIGTVWPEPNSTAAGNRMLQLITLFQQKGYSVSFLSSANKGDYSHDLESLQVATYPVTLNDASFDTLIKELNPTIVLFDRFMMEEQYGWRIIENCPNALRILDTEDLHFLRKVRENAYKKNEVITPKDYITDIFKRELTSIYRCDLSLMISRFEMQLLTETFKVNESILTYLPFLVEPISIKTYERLPKHTERTHFVSIGNFFHEPNWQTVLQLKKCWKSIKKALPEAELHIYGAYVSPKAQQLHNEKEGFLIKGRAISVAEVFSKARILLAPIPYGAGLKGKLLESMQMGLPNITTQMGAEAMHEDLPWNGFISDSEEDFVEKAIELYSNESLWNEKQKNGIDLVNNQFDKSLYISSFTEKIAHLLSNLETHRCKNFLGQIFNHQTLASTKYMSKWIELKNKG